MYKLHASIERQGLADGVSWPFSNCEINYLHCYTGGAYLTTISGWLMSTKFASSCETRALFVSESVRSLKGQLVTSLFPPLLQLKAERENLL